MPDALFTGQDGRYVPTEQGRGPWAPDQLHGGAMAALLARVLVDGAAGEDAGDSWFPARFTAEFVRPLLITPVQVTTEIIRVGRKARLTEVRLTWPDDGDKLVARATLQQVRRAEVPVDDGNPAKAWARAEEARDPEAAPKLAMRAIHGDIAFHATATSHRSEGGLLASSTGPGRDWIRVDADLLPGEPLRPFERVVAAADFGNGISASLDFERYTFVNPDLTVSLFRLPVDEWVLLDAATHTADEGVGLAAANLYDRQGRLGSSTQSLVIDAR